VGILVKDANRLVHMAAINNPRLQYSDIKKMASNKSMPDGVIRFIAQNRDWTRHYDVIVSLVNNPKTPLDKAMAFMNTLRTNDLRQLQSNRNVSQQLARQAKIMMSKRMGG
jgi:isochorismate hydrolase